MLFSRLFVACLLCLLAVAPAGLCQENSGRILGTVTDDTGAVVLGAKITATSPALPRGLETTTDGAGNYAFPSLPVGSYTVTVAKTGFTTVRQSGIEVKLGSQITFNARLAVGAVTETVEVTAGADILETTSSRTSTNISASQFENLARGRSYVSLLAIAPGVRIESKAGAGGVQVDGASGSENAFIIDGVDATDVFSGEIRGQYQLPLQFVKEFQVKSGGFEAEYGGANGGVINVATRSGTNGYHGEAGVEFTNNQLYPRPRGYWQASPLNTTLPDFYAPTKDGFRTVWPGASLGGPILKDRLFFFGGYYPTFGRTERINRYPDPTGTRQYVQETAQHYGLGRLDYIPTQKVQINSSWIWTPYRSKGRLPSTDTRLAPPSNDLSVQGGFIPSQSYTASVTYTPTGHLLLTARYGYKYLNDKGSNYGLAGAPYVTYQTAATQALGVPAEYQKSAGYSNVSSTFGIIRDIQTRHNVYLDGSYILGAHTLKTGYAINRVGNDVNDDYMNGRFLIYWGEAYNRGSFTNRRGAYGYYIWRDGVRHNAKVNGRNQGFYLQDTWRVHPRVTINAGLRFENEFLPPYKAEVNGKKVANPVAFGWGDKLAPRLGAAWDITGRGTWKLSGSFGYFYDVMKYELARGSFGGDYWWDHVYQLDSPNVFSLSKANPGALGVKITQYDNRTIPINARGELEGIDPNIRPYSTREFTVTLEHALNSRLTAGVRFTRKDLLRAIEDIGVLDAEDNEVYLIGSPGFGRTRKDPEHIYDGKTPNGKEFLVPPATRRYDGVEFSLRGRPARSLHVIASYTYSRLWGNFAGLANSDENGRDDPNVSRAFDLPYYYFDASGSQKNVFGRLATDRPHALKLFGNYELKTKAGSTFFSVNQIAESGIPDSTSVIYLSAPTYPFGRGDLGRTPVLTETDLAVYHDIRVSERTTLRLQANSGNVLNQAAVMRRSTQINRSSAISESRLPVQKFFAGYKVSDFVNPQNLRGNPPINPVYTLPTEYQGRRSIRLGITLMF